MSDCPGRLKCHGPASWCDQCGDVDLVCDDPRCDVHRRGSERFAECIRTEDLVFKATSQLRDAKRDHEAAMRSYTRWQFGNPVMVAKVRTRCAICGWPLKEKIEDGCVEGNCSMRERL